jgi:hypothetical protein
MPKYQIDWTEEVWKRIVVDADSREDVWKKFSSGDFDDVMAEAIAYGGETQDSIEITEVE